MGLAGSFGSHSAPSSALERAGHQDGSVDGLTTDPACAALPSVLRADTRGSPQPPHLEGRAAPGTQQAVTDNLEHMLLLFTNPVTSGSSAPLCSVSPPAKWGRDHWCGVLVRRGASRATWAAGCGLSGPTEPRTCKARPRTGGHGPSSLTENESRKFRRCKQSPEAVCCDWKTLREMSASQTIHHPGRAARWGDLGCVRKFTLHIEALLEVYILLH